MISKNIFILIGSIKFYGITQLYVLNYMDLSLIILLESDRTDRCIIMCSITSHDKIQSTHVDNTISFDHRAIPKNVTTVAL